MVPTKLVVAGIFVGIILGAALFYTLFAQLYQISNLPSQIAQPQNSSQGAFTQFEQLQFISAYASISDSNFQIAVLLKNTGSTAATIDTVFLNAIPIGSISGANYQFDSVNIAAGAIATGNITLPRGATWKSGMSVEVMVQTVAGNQYSKVIALP